MGHHSYEPGSARPTRSTNPPPMSDPPPHLVARDAADGVRQAAHAVASFARVVGLVALAVVAVLDRHG